MTSIFILLIVSTLLAYYSSKKKYSVFTNQYGQSIQTKNIYYIREGIFLLILILACFVGLRTSYNDTSNYIRGFKALSTGFEAIQNLDLTLGSYPGFMLSIILIKSFISENPQVMIFLVSSISIVLLILFYKRWSVNFAITIFVFITSGFLLFTMAAMKQFSAMAIGITAITFFLNGRKFWFVFLVLLGSTFHPYLLLYLIVFFLTDKVWSGKSLLLVLSIIAAGIFIGYFLEFAYNITESIGKDYKETEELMGQGVNIFRFLFYCITPVLLFLKRNQINYSGNKAEILFANLTLIGWGFMFIALFANANMLGRMANYFDPFMHLTLATILIKYFKGSAKKYVTFFCLTGYFLFFLFELVTRGFEYHWIISI